MNKKYLVWISLVVIVIVVVYIFSLKKNEGTSEREPAVSTESVQSTTSKESKFSPQQKIVTTGQEQTSESDITKAKIGSIVFLTGSYGKGEISKETYNKGIGAPLTEGLYFHTTKDGLVENELFFSNSDEAEKMFAIDQKNVRIQKTTNGKIQLNICNYFGTSTIEARLESIDSDPVTGSPSYSVTLLKVIDLGPVTEDCFTVDGSI